jgi:hypothetical protein
MVKARFAALLIAVFAAGCAIRPNSDVAQFAADTDENSFEVFDRNVQSTDALVLPVVHDRQTAGPSCGAHALASVVNYWRGAGTLEGNALYAATPPANRSGYSMAELLQLANANGLLASAVRMPREGLMRELEAGRPVLLPVRLPSIYVQQRSFPGAQLPVVGVARNAVINQSGRVSELTGALMVDHYLLVVGYDDNKFVVVEPVMGYRTISYDRLERYREHFGEAAIVFSRQTGRRASR